MDLVRGTVLEPPTTPEGYTTDIGGYFVWSYPDVSDQVWESEVRPVAYPRIIRLIDRLKILSGSLSQSGSDPQGMGQLERRINGTDNTHVIGTAIPSLWGGSRAISQLCSRSNVQYNCPSHAEARQRLGLGRDAALARRSAGRPARCRWALG